MSKLPRRKKLAKPTRTQTLNNTLPQEIKDYIQEYHKEFIETSTLYMLDKESETLKDPKIKKFISEEVEKHKKEEFDKAIVKAFNEKRMTLQGDLISKMQATFEELYEQRKALELADRLVERSSVVSTSILFLETVYGTIHLTQICGSSKVFNLHGEVKFHPFRSVNAKLPNSLTANIPRIFSFILDFGSQVGYEICTGKVFKSDVKFFHSKTDKKHLKEAAEVKIKVDCLITLDDNKPKDGDATKPFQ